MFKMFIGWYPRLNDDKWNENFYNRQIKAPVHFADFFACFFGKCKFKERLLDGEQ